MAQTEDVQQTATDSSSGAAAGYINRTDAKLCTTYILEEEVESTMCLACSNLRATQTQTPRQSFVDNGAQTSPDNRDQILTEIINKISALENIEMMSNSDFMS